jgi:hypothetical protein
MYMRICHYDQEARRKKKEQELMFGHIHVRLEAPCDGLMPSATSALRILTLKVEALS